MKNTIQNTLAAVAFLAVATFNLHAAPATFDFKDPKGVNNVRFELDAPLEAITGTGTGISGTVQFDPAAPAATTGKIVLATSSLATGNAMMTSHIHGEGWLDAKAHPEIVFEAVKLSRIKTEGNKTTATVAGKLTLKGVTKEVTTPVTFTYLPGKLGARIGKPDVKGDLLVIRANFTINRSDFGIQPGKNIDKVAEEIQIALSVAGAAPTK